MSQASATQALHSSARRGDISAAVTTDPHASDRFLLELVRIFDLSSVSIAEPGGEVYTAGIGGDGNAWVTNSSDSGCARWALSEEGSRSASGICEDPLGSPLFTSNDGASLAWGVGNHSGPVAETLVVAGREVQALNERLADFRESAYEKVWQGESRAQWEDIHIFVVDAESGLLIGSTDAEVAEALVNRQCVQLRGDGNSSARSGCTTLPGNRALEGIQELVSDEDESLGALAQDGYLAKSADFPSLEHIFEIFGLLSEESQELQFVLSCASLSNHRGHASPWAAPEGWAACTQVPAQYYVTFLTRVTWHAPVIFVVGFCVVFAWQHFEARQMRKQEDGQDGPRSLGSSKTLTRRSIWTIAAALVLLFFLLDHAVEQDINMLTDDLTRQISSTVEQRISHILDTPQQALSLISAHRSMGTLVQGNTSRESPPARRFLRASVLT